MTRIVIVGVFLLVLAGTAHAAGVRFGIGCVGVCDREQTVVGGSTTCVIAMDNVASDVDFLRVDQLRIEIDHFDGPVIFENIVKSPDGTEPPAIFISPHSEFQWTFQLRPQPDDLLLPDQILPLRVEASGVVLFDGASVGVNNAASSDLIHFASFGDITHVLATNPPTCEAASAALASRNVLRRPHHVAAGG